MIDKSFMAEQEHKLRGKVKLRSMFPEYDPVVDSVEGKHTTISLVDYCHSTGLIMRSARRNEKILAYTVKNPKEVFERLFPKFIITRYMGRELFSSGDFKNDTPMVGLALYSTDAIPGINGNLGEFVSEGFFEKAKRDCSISAKQIERIIENVSGYGMTTNGEFHAKMSPRFKQREFDKQQLVDLLTPYLQNP